MPSRFSALSLGALWSDRIIRAGFLVALAILLTLIGLLIWVIPSNPDGQALHYNIYFGIDLFGPGRSLWIHPTAIVLVLVINVLVAGLAVERQTTAARLAMWSAAIFAAIVLAATVLVAVFAART